MLHAVSSFHIIYYIHSFSNYAHLMPIHDSPKKNWFIGAVEAGKSIRAAAATYDISPATAQDIWKKFQETSTTHMWSGHCQPAKITNQLKRSVIRKARANQRLALGLVGKLVTPQILATAVQRILDNVGMHRGQGHKVVYLTKDYKQHRKEWAWEHKSWAEEDWNRVIWSDKCYVYIGDD